MSIYLKSTSRKNHRNIFASPSTKRSTQFSSYQSPEVKQTAQALSNKFASKISSPVASFPKIAISKATLEALKNEADNEASYPINLYKLAGIWINSDIVMHLHANPTEEEQSNTGANNSDVLIRSIQRLHIDPDSRSKELKSALNQLEQKINSLTTNVNSWEDAKMHLQEVLVLPEEADLVEEEVVPSLLHRIRNKTKLGPRSRRTKGKKTGLGLTEYRRMLEMRSKRSKLSLNLESKWSQIRLVSSKFGFRPKEEDDKIKLKQDQQQPQEKKGAETAITDWTLSPFQKFEQMIQSRIQFEEQKKLEKKLEEERLIQEERRRKEEEKKAEEARKAAMELLKPLSDEEKDRVHQALYGHGPLDEKLAVSSNDSVQRKSMQTLRPGQWLNDEVIHYFYSMLANRDEALSAATSGRKRSHFFMSFFFTKLFDEGATNQYRYQNVKRWSKKVPGKDIFALDKVFFACNVNGAHWTCAVIFMQKKKIQYFDSMSGSGTNYVQGLFQYLQDEWKAKKGGEMPDLDQWELVYGHEGDDIPQQHNGYDCGVFTCMFADFLSVDRPLSFNQTHINQCRDRIALSILNGRAIE